MSIATCGVCLTSFREEKINARVCLGGQLATFAATVLSWILNEKWWYMHEGFRMRSLHFAVSAVISVMVIWRHGTASAQDVAAGEKSFRKCLPCHSIGPGAQNKVGPEQNGLDGRKSGTVPGYSYSQANKNSGIVWSEATFKEYIVDPRAKIPAPR